MIYIDEVIVLNFIIDYLLLLFTSMLLKLNVRKYKLIIEEEYISESDSPHNIEKIINSYCEYT